MRVLYADVGAQWLVAAGLIIFFIVRIGRALSPPSRPTSRRAPPGPRAQPPRQASVTLQALLQQMEEARRAQTASAPRAAMRPPPVRAVAQDQRGPLGRIGGGPEFGATPEEEQTSLTAQGLKEEEARLRVEEAAPASEVFDYDTAGVARPAPRIALRARVAAATPPSGPQPAATVASPPSPGYSQLKDAIIWREILGPPLALQEDDHLS